MKVCEEQNLQTPVRFRAPQQIQKPPHLCGGFCICCGAGRKLLCVRPESNERSHVFALPRAKTDELSQRVLMSVSELETRCRFRARYYVIEKSCVFLLLLRGSGIERPEGRVLKHGRALRPGEEPHNIFGVKRTKILM